jgi:hypothetical protein
MARHGRMMSEYKDQFVRDLDPASPGWPATLGELSARLKAWRATLHSTVEDSMPPSLRLEDEARNLQACTPRTFPRMPPISSFLIACLWRKPCAEPAKYTWTRCAAHDPQPAGERFIDCAVEFQHGLQWPGKAVDGF